MYGTQTSGFGDTIERAFENDVKMYGTQTGLQERFDFVLFENDVKMYGTQTKATKSGKVNGLRMM